MATFDQHEQSGGATSRAFSIPSFTTDEIKVRVGNVLKTAATHYNITSYTVNGGTVTWTSGNVPANGSVIRIYRDTKILNNAGSDVEAQATYQAGSAIKQDDLNDNQKQVLRALEEKDDQFIQTFDVEPQAIDGTKIADDSIDSQHYAAGSIDLEHMSADSVNSDQYVNGSIDLIHLSANSVDSSKIVDGSIVNDDVNASAAIAGTKISPAFGSQNISTSGTLAAGATTVTGNIVVSGTVDGRDIAALGSKLDGIEAGATSNQTNTEIRAAVEAASDSNVFTDADHTLLNSIESGATADQTAAEIRALVEAASDSNVFTDADHSLLNSIESGATADQSNAEIRAAVEAASDSNVFTDADHSRLDGLALTAKGTIAVGDGVGEPTILAVGTNNHVLVADSNEASGVKWATVPAGSGLSNIVEDTSPQLGGALDVQAQEINTSTTNGNIKLTPNGTGLVEVKGNTNPGTLQLNCENNSHSVKIKGPAHSAAASYTLTLPNDDGSANEVLKTDGSGNLDWVAQTDTVYTHPNHSGDVTSSADGATTIANNAVTAAKTDLSIVQGDVIYGTGTDAWARLAKGTAGQALIMNSGATAPEWGAAGATIANDANNRVITADGSAGLNGEANLTFDGSTLALTGNQTATLAVQAQGYEAPATVTANWSIGAANNAFFPGPMTVGSGVTVTVPADRTLTIV